MKQKHYSELFAERGLDIPTEQARRYKQLLLNDEYVLPYLKARLCQPMPDKDWMLKVSEGAPGRQELAGNGIIDEDEIVKAMMSEAQKVFAHRDLNDLLKALANWYDVWLGENGLKVVRNTINSKVHAQRSKKHPIALHHDTYERNNALLELTPEAKSFDDLQNILHSVFADARGIDLDSLVKGKFES